MRLRRKAYFGVVAAPPLVSATIESVTGDFVEGGTVNIAARWNGGTAPYKVTLNNERVINNVTSTSITISETAVAGHVGYIVTVQDALGVSVTSSFFSAPTYYIRSGSPSHYFNTSTKAANFYSNATGKNTPSIAWYVSINGAPYQFWTTATVWTSGTFDPQTVLIVYYSASNEAGIVYSGSLTVGYQ